MGDPQIITKDKIENWPCPCGCGKEFPCHTGLLHYDGDSHAVYRALLMRESQEDPHLWVLLGTGPWFEGDERGCWLTLHSWVTSDGSLTTRIEDPGSSPFTPQDAFDERLLERDEVLGRSGASEWAFRCSDLLVDKHPAVSAFVRVGT